MSLLVAPLLVACAASNQTAGKDVSITACNADPSGGHPTADGTIVNHSSKASTYILDVAFYDAAGNKVSEGGASVGKVDPAATANFHAPGVAGAKGPLTCKAVTVTRVAAP